MTSLESEHETRSINNIPWIISTLTTGTRGNSVFEITVPLHKYTVQIYCWFGVPENVSLGEHLSFYIWITF